MFGDSLEEEVPYLRHWVYPDFDVIPESKLSYADFLPTP